MRLYLSILALAVLLPGVASASVTWTSNTQTSTAVCTTGSETSTPPTTDPCTTTHGLCLSGIGGFTVHAEAAGAFTAGGFLAAYLWNPRSEQWNRAPDLDLYFDSSLSDQAWSGFSVPSSTGGVAFLPSGGGVAVTVYLVATGSR